MSFVRQNSVQLSSPPPVIKRIEPKTPNKKRHSLIDDPETNPMNPVVRFDPSLEDATSRVKRNNSISLMDNPETNPMKPVMKTNSPGVLLAVEETLQRVYKQVNVD